MESMMQENSVTRGATAVLDIGKTNAKLTLIAEDGSAMATRRIASRIVGEGPYPHHDTERIWDWLLATLREFAQSAWITAIVPVTHGATAALVDDNGLVLPVMDYESDLPQSLASYGALRPAFAESFSPDLPAGLNLGRQLAWQAQTFPEQFGRTRHILNYPQYWAWRLSGVAASEVTSLGCHTDLWQPLRGEYSSLVTRMGWTGLFPAQQPAWAPLGPLLPGVATATGLPAGCQVLCGIHDSNASLLRYLSADAGKAAGAAGPSRAVLSTGTWVIAAAFGKALEGLEESADMLANVNALGRPVACMRFMGGREFGVLAGPDPVPCSQADLERLIGQGTFALPCFSESGGPFVGRSGTVEGPAPATAGERYALATLYCVLMSDYCLTALGAAGPVVVEGSFTDNPYFAPLLAALRKPQTVALTDDASGTTCGGWMLHRWGSTPALHSATARPLDLPGWMEYRKRWLAQLGQTVETALTA
jgi:L-fuculokinase